MSHLNKYLIMAILITAINIPMYFYSKAFLKEPQIAAEHAPDVTSTQHENEHGDLVSQENTEGLATKHATTEATSHLQEELSAQERPARFQSISELYKPPLLGRCKKLFERFNRKKFEDKPFKAFVYSFDGENAYCADAYTDKGQEAAEEIVIRDCEEHHAGSGKYSPCRIYSSE